MSFKHTPQEARKLWVEALRSGEFEQTKYVLCDSNNRRCCLGVAVELFNRHERPLDQRKRDATAVAYLEGEEEYHNNLPPSVVDWLGLRSCGGGYHKGVRETSLWQKNDIFGATFQQIADIIESAPPGLFVEEES